MIAAAATSSPRARPGRPHAQPRRSRPQSTRSGRRPCRRWPCRDCPPAPQVASGLGHDRAAALEQAAAPSRAAARRAAAGRSRPASRGATEELSQLSGVRRDNRRRSRRPDGDAGCRAGIGLEPVGVESQTAGPGGSHFSDQRRRGRASPKTRSQGQDISGSGGVQHCTCRLPGRLARRHLRQGHGQRLQTRRCHGRLLRGPNRDGHQAGTAADRAVAGESSGTGHAR